MRFTGTVRDRLYDEQVCLPWNPIEAVYSFGDGTDGWVFEERAVESNTVFILLSASGKTGLSFAYALKHCRSKDKPQGVFAIGSKASEVFTTGTGLFDKVLLYDACDSDLESELGLTPSNKIIICNFEARDGAGDRWARNCVEAMMYL